jgi:hypothetical protein
MPAVTINGRTYEEIAVTATAAKPLPVNIGSATLSVTADGVEIKNDSGNPIPISDAGGSITVDGPLTDAQLRATLVGVEPLGIPAVARQLAAGSASANTALTSTCRRISVRAVGADIRYAIGSSSQTASGTSHFIANGERLDLAVPATPNIAVIRNASTSGTLEVTELS